MDGGSYELYMVPKDTAGRTDPTPVWHSLLTLPPCKPVPDVCFAADLSTCQNRLSVLGAYHVDGSNLVVDSVLCTFLELILSPTAGGEARRGRLGGLHRPQPVCGPGQGHE